MQGRHTWSKCFVFSYRYYTGNPKRPAVNTERVREKEKRFLLTVPWQILCCNSSCVGGFTCGICFVIICALFLFFWCLVKAKLVIVAIS